MNITNSELWANTGYFNLNQYNYINELIIDLKPKNILEIGYATCRSTASILYNGHKYLDKMILYDYFNNDDYKIKDKILIKYDNNNKIQFLKNLNIDNLKNYFDNGIDFSLISSQLEYTECYNYISKIYDLTNVNGIILVNDYDSYPPDGVRIDNVTMACDDSYKNIIKNSNSIIEKWYYNGKGFFKIIKK